MVVNKVDQSDYRKISIHSKKLVVKYITTVTTKRNKQHGLKSANYNLVRDVTVMLLRGETGENTTALIELVQVQGAHGKTARPLRLMGHLKRLHHISPLSRKQTFLISKQRKVQSL